MLRTPLNKTSSYTLADLDNGKTIVIGGTTDKSLTVPNYDRVRIRNGVEIGAYRTGTGAVKIMPEAGVTIERSDTGEIVLSSGIDLSHRFAEISLWKRGRNIWVLTGMLA